MTILVEMSKGPFRIPTVIGPRTSAIKTLLGERVTDAEVLTDLSEWGVWSNSGPLECRPPELWVDRVHDAVGGAE